MNGHDSFEEPLENPTKRLFAALETGDLTAVRQAIDNGADVNATNEEGLSTLVVAHRYLLSKADRNDSLLQNSWEIISTLIEANVVPNETEKHLVAPLQFPLSAWEPEYLMTAETLKSLSDFCKPDHLAPGTMFFFRAYPQVAAELSPSKAKDAKKLHEKEFDAAVERLQRLALRTGSILVRGGGYNVAGADSREGWNLELFPTDDKYDAMALIGIGDWEDGKGPEHVIPRLKQFEQRWPFHLRGCTMQELDLEFVEDIKEAKYMIHELKSLFYMDCWWKPDEIEHAARRLNGQRRLKLRLTWW